ncbi:MAG: hypothetical protein ABSG64_11630 [Solirubrobacteraceae bacterium]
MRSRCLWPIARASLTRLALAVMLGTLAIVALTGTGGTGATGPSPTPALQRNEQAAQAEARSLVTNLKLPSGAVRSAVEPSGDNGTLSNATVTVQIPDGTSASGWWIVPSSQQSVVAFLNANPPGTPSMHSDNNGVDVVGFTLPPVNGVLESQLIIVDVAPLAGGDTGVRADAQVSWVVPRPATERVPTATRLIRLRTVNESTGDQPSRWRAPTSIAAPLKIAAVVALMNRLPLDQQGMCFGGSPVRAVARLTFYGRNGGPPLAVAKVYPVGCGGGVAMTIDGHAQPALSDSYQEGSHEVLVIARLNSILHIHLPGAP